MVPSCDQISMAVMMRSVSTAWKSTPMLAVVAGPVAAGGAAREVGPMGEQGGDCRLAELGGEVERHDAVHDAEAQHGEEDAGRGEPEATPTHGRPVGVEDSAVSRLGRCDRHRRADRE